MKKLCLFLSLLLLSLMFTASACAAGNNEIVVISSLSEHKNKHLNILMDNHADYRFESQKHNIGERAQQVTLSIFDANGLECDSFPSDVQLYFWRFGGMQPDNLSYYSISITHKDTAGNTIAVYNTDDGTIRAYEQYGLCIQTDKPGIFELSYTVADNIGPAWDEIFEKLENTTDASFDLDGVRVIRKNNELTIRGLRKDSRISSDIFLNSEDFPLPFSRFTFDNVELQELVIHVPEHEDWTFHFTESSSIRRGIEINQWNSNSRVHLINDTKIEDLNPHLSQRDFPFVLDIYEGSSFHLTGKGSIPVSYCLWHTGTLEYPFIEEKAACINVFVNAASSSDAVPALKKAFSNIHLDHKQFSSKDLSSCVRTVLLYTDSEDYTREIVYKDHPAAKNISEINGDNINILLPDAHQKVDVTFRVSINDQTDSQNITYDIALVDQDNNTVSLENGAYLYIPYPDGMDLESSKQYEFTVTHYMAFGEEVFSTRNGTIERTDKGLRLKITSASPYILSWNTTEVTADNLPHTGDSSHIILHAALLTLCCAILCIIRRRGFYA